MARRRLQPTANSDGHKDHKKDNALTSLVGAQSCCALIASEGAARLRPYGHDRPRVYRRNGGPSSYSRFFVPFVAINSPYPARIFEDGNTRCSLRPLRPPVKSGSEFDPPIGINRCSGPVSRSARSRKRLRHDGCRPSRNGPAPGPYTCPFFRLACGRPAMLIFEHHVCHQPLPAAK